MCIVCLEWEKGQLTNQEAHRALREMMVVDGKSEENDHYLEAWEKIARTEELETNGTD